MKDKYRVIYQPRGAALEYSPLAVNLAIGCDHGCKYCYAPSCMKKTRESYLTPKARSGILKKLALDAREMKEAGDNRRVLFCFITDPYQKSATGELTRKALEILNSYNIAFQVLTKGGMRAVKDFDLYKKTDAYAATIVFDNDEEGLKWEPNADLISGRIQSLKAAKDKGIETWVSMEPVIFPEQAMSIIDQTKDFVDLYKIGKINNFKIDHKPDWKKFTHEVIEKLERENKKYYIKDSLKPYL